MRKTSFALALLTAAALAACGGSSPRGGDQTPATKFSAQVSFGDSLSDVGTYSVGTVKALGGGKPFIRPFMAMEASSHYALDITLARDLLGWAPRHRLLSTLPEIVARLKRDPKGWYKANKIEPSPEASH